MAQTGKVFGHYILAWSESCIVSQSTLEIQEIPGVTLRVHATKQSKQLYCIQTLRVLSCKNSLLLSSPHFTLVTTPQCRPFPGKPRLHEQFLLHLSCAGVRGALPQQSHVTEHDQNIFCASLSSFWSEVYENWDLSKEPTQIQTCLLFPNPAAQTAVFILLSQNIKLWFPSPLFLSKGRVVALVLFCLVCCSCWHVRGEQHPSYNGFGSWIHCVVTCCSGLSPHFSISLAELQAVQCQKTNYRGIYPVLGLVGCYSALTELAMMDWVRSTACGTIFLALQRDFSSYFWTNALC